MLAVSTYFDQKSIVGEPKPPEVTALSSWSVYSPEQVLGCAANVSGLDCSCRMCETQMDNSIVAPSAENRSLHSLPQHSADRIPD